MNNTWKEGLIHCTHRPASIPPRVVGVVFRFVGLVSKKICLTCSLPCQDLFFGAEIAIVESCLPRERKLKWIPPNVTMSDGEGYSSLKTDETHGIKEAGSLWMASSVPDGLINSAMKEQELCPFC
jgi:hypothetical protein